MENTNTFLYVEEILIIYGHFVQGLKLFENDQPNTKYGAISVNVVEK